MSILIKNMKMPKDCLHCGLHCGFCDGKIYCNVLYRYVEFDNESRDEECPMIEIKEPHGRLIEVTDRLMYEACAYEAWTGIDEVPVEFASSLLDRAPTIVEAEE